MKATLSTNQVITRAILRDKARCCIPRVPSTVKSGVRTAAVVALVVTEGHVEGEPVRQPLVRDPGRCGRAVIVDVDEALQPVAPAHTVDGNHGLAWLLAPAADAAGAEGLLVGASVEPERRRRDLCLADDDKVEVEHGREGRVPGTLNPTHLADSADIVVKLSAIEVELDLNGLHRITICADIAEVARLDVLRVVGGFAVVLV